VGRLFIIVLGDKGRSFWLI